MRTKFMRATVLAIAAVFAILGPIRPVYACSCKALPLGDPLQLAGQHNDFYKHAVIGRVTSVGKAIKAHPDDQPEGNYIPIKMTTEVNVTGDTPKTITVLQKNNPTANSTAEDCSFGFAIGATYLLEAHQNADGTFQTSGCTLTSLYASAPSAVTDDSSPASSGGSGALLPIVLVGLLFAGAVMVIRSSRKKSVPVAPPATTDLPVADPWAPDAAAYDEAEAIAQDTAPDDGVDDYPTEGSTTPVEPAHSYETPIGQEATAHKVATGEVTPAQPVTANPVTPEPAQDPTPEPDPEPIDWAPSQTASPSQPEPVTPVEVASPAPEEPAVESEPAQESPSSAPTAAEQPAETAHESPSSVEAPAPPTTPPTGASQPPGADTRPNPDREVRPSWAGPSSTEFNSPAPPDEPLTRQDDDEPTEPGISG